jgi:3'(2'), 5'-bisphosphate nucleotidase
MNTLIPPADIQTLLSIAQLAARDIMAVYASDFAMTKKADLSPVTEADALAEKTILAGLAQHWPDVPVLAEEQTAAGVIPILGNRFFLVDPLDGTKEFLSRNGEFTVNIALVENGVPMRGVVYAPAIDRMFWGDKSIGAATATVAPADSLMGKIWESIKVRKAPRDGLTVVASRSHGDDATEAFLAKHKIKKRVSAGSSLKFCMVAAGEADLYPRFGRTMEWDTGAGQAVLEAAGGRVCQEDGTPLTYGKAERGFDNPAFIASS